MPKRHMIGTILGLSLLVSGLYFIFSPRTMMRYEDVAQQYLRGLASDDEAAILEILPNADPRYET
jgi:hypothetical protein